MSMDLETSKIKESTITLISYPCLTTKFFIIYIINSILNILQYKKIIITTLFFAFTLNTFESLFLEILLHMYYIGFS
jgi:hypothetical protein